jgi:hypothetical protein
MINEEEEWRKRERKKKEKGNTFATALRTLCI